LRVRQATTVADVHVQIADATRTVQPNRGSRPRFQIQGMNAHPAGSQRAAKILYIQEWIVANAVGVEDGEAHQIILNGFAIAMFEKNGEQFQSVALSVSFRIGDVFQFVPIPTGDVLAFILRVTGFFRIYAVAPGKTGFNTDLCKDLLSFSRAFLMKWIAGTAAADDLTDRGLNFGTKTKNPGQTGGNDVRESLHGIVADLDFLKFDVDRVVIRVCGSSKITMKLIGCSS